MEQNDFSLKCEKIKQQIIDLLSNNNLPPIIQYYITKELYTQIESSYINYIKVQLKQQQKQQKKETGIE